MNTFIVWYLNLLYISIILILIFHKSGGGGEGGGGGGGCFPLNFGPRDIHKFIESDRWYNYRAQFLTLCSFIFC